ncbi:hypothetical protein PS15p_208626 [Mucor circinelloides]
MHNSQLLSCKINQFKVVCDHKYYGIIPFLLLFQEFCGAIDKTQHRRRTVSLQVSDSITEAEEPVEEREDFQSTGTNVVEPVEAPSVSAYFGSNCEQVDIIP